ncbi:hemin-degrading factor [Phaeobacter sp. QD34_3]|uniref:hemin-degrading factor n=1 Tax=unclassified Phaeobacter TaxID=2621772 RepID=UPI00237FD2BD|nr:MULTISPECIES: ChuX/HutX family heme-like substrate-binding protein [unclassified Phaeobacter]MDE4133139.1 hemin-degrading factor [Phaeobacter sp. QD34_3]MDE4136791.1 hemin-degrading factor [Phaeobacter sp. QD34_24]
MTTQTSPSAAEIRSARAENAQMRDRDFAAKLNITEAQLVAAYCGAGVTQISARPDDVFPRLEALGEVMALTRNESCVIEKVGTYSHYRSGERTSLVLTPEIDLRLFLQHFAYAFAVEREGKKGLARSIQFFDAAGDAVHKVHLREASNLEAWETLVADLALAEQSDTLDVAPRTAAEGARENPEKVDILRREWAEMTDTHQFQRLCSKLKMNRLGAYRIVGEPMARKLSPDTVNPMLEAVRDQGIEVMLFVGNRGCIQIHGGPIKTLREMGPWQNILDPGFDLHLRLDHVAEVWAVNKPTKRGDAISFEAFDAEGTILFQVFGRRTDDSDSRPAWNAIVAALPSLTTELETA